MSKLKKHIGWTTDNKGCSFHYTCLTELDGSKVYYCSEFPAIEAKTLKELKQLLSSK